MPPVPTTLEVSKALRSMSVRLRQSLNMRPILVHTGVAMFWPLSPAGWPSVVSA